VYRANVHVNNMSETSLPSFVQKPLSLQLCMLSIRYYYYLYITTYIFLSIRIMTIVQSSHSFHDRCDPWCCPSRFPRRTTCLNNKMPGNKCQYFNCFNTTTKFPNISMFRIPKDERHETWIINSGEK